MCLPLAAIVVVLAMRCGLALLWLAVGLWLTMGLGPALVLRRAV